MYTKEQKDTIDTIKKLYRIKEDCPIIDSNGIWDDEIQNAYGLLRLNKYATIYKHIDGVQVELMKREFIKYSTHNVDVLKYNYFKNPKDCIYKLWEEILFHSGTDYGYDGSKNPKNSVRIQGIMFIELCQSEALPYEIILLMARTLKTRRRAVYRLYRIINFKVVKAIEEKRIQEKEEHYKQVLALRAKWHNL